MCPVLTPEVIKVEKYKYGLIKSPNAPLIGLLVI